MEQFFNKLEKWLIRYIVVVGIAIFILNVIRSAS